MSAETLSASVGAVGTAVSVGPSLGASMETGIKSAPSLSSSFGQDRFMPSLNKDIFSNTKPATLFTDFQDRPVFSKSILKDTVPIAVAAKEVFKEMPAQDVQEIDLGKPTEVSFDLPKFDFGIDVEKIEETDSKAALEVKEDLKLASNVRGLLVEVGFPENRANDMVSKSLTEALGNKGIELKTRAEPMAYEEAKTETEEKITVKDEEKVRDKDEDKEDKKKRKEETIFERKFVKDEYADEARRKDATRAVEIAFRSEEPKSGEEIVVNMHEKPNPDEMSGLALELGQDSDGSYEEIVKELREMSFDSMEDAKRKVGDLIAEKPAVRLGKGKQVGKNDVKRVLMTLKSIISDQWFSPASRGLFGE